MATIQGLIRDVSSNGNVRVIEWVGLGAGDDGAPAAWTEFADRCIQVSGTFGGASVTVMGSNDGVNWAVLSDPQGNPLTLSSARIEQALELPLYVRPVVNGGDTSTSLLVTICMRKA